ncbi:unnamed protein product [Durusdinium trenchii]|uniref:Uncharacterized protein n=1 Tax=Durusdinium trenchii TaxID=1381693 RepID=A0ABP0M3I9_9DINO
MLPLISGTRALQHARVVGYASQRVASVIDRIQGGTRVAGHEDVNPCHTVGWVHSTYFSLSTKRYSTHDAFVQPKQVPTHVLRRREGWGVHSPAGARFGRVVNTTERLILEPTEEERKLASQLKAVGNQKSGHRQWHNLYAEYSGSSPLVLTAAM